jgi:succinoglycan biosynthesis protein ExoM
MIKVDKIDVCIATFRRPILLFNLLNSLMRQDLSGIEIRIIVVDNDLNETARTVITAFREKYSTDIIYDVEPVKNIAHARNRAIQHVTSDYFVFVDDDEIVSEKWLLSLLNTMKELNADLVFGPVISILPTDSPAWAKSLFERKEMRTGESLRFGGAGNVMLKRAVLDDIKTKFNPDFGLTGGEDTDFFYRLYLLRKTLIWCEEAKVSEHVPLSRVSLKWLRQRGFRSGQTYNRIVIARYSLAKKSMWFLTKVTQLLVAAIAVPFIRLLSYKSYVSLTVRMSATAGQLSRCFSEKNFEEYRV